MVWQFADESYGIGKEKRQVVYHNLAYGGVEGTIIVARDIAHAKLKARLDAGEEMPEYFKNHPILYAGPAKTPEGYPCGSMGPTTANRMDPYVDEFQDHGASLVMIAKGNRGDVVTEACPLAIGNGRSG